MIHFNVAGHPAAQGSKRHVGGGRLVEMDKKLPVWRADVITAAKQAAGPGFEPMDGHLEAELTVYLPRPKTTQFGSRPAGPPDLDKLQRAVGDALKLAKVITDDSRIVRWTAEKEWATGEPGATVTVIKLQEEEKTMAKIPDVLDAFKRIETPNGSVINASRLGAAGRVVGIRLELPERPTDLTLALLERLRGATSLNAGDTRLGINKARAFGTRIHTFRAWHRDAVEVICGLRELVEGRPERSLIYIEAADKLLAELVKQLNEEAELKAA